MFFFYAIIFFSGKSFVKPNLSSLKGRDRRTWIYMELTYEPIVKQNSRIFHHAPFSSSALCETFKRTQHVSTFCSFIFLASAFITYVGDQCDVFFLTRSFIGIKSMGLRPWSVNFFVWFTLFDVMLPCYLSWWNSSKLVLKKNWVQMFDSVESFGWNSGDTLSEVSSRIFHYIMPPWHSRWEKERSRGTGNYGKTSVVLK